MDAFYASVEQRDRPELRGRPVIVGADPKGRGVVSAASYEARVFGVRSAMPISRAYRLCPHGVYLPVDMDKYARVSREIMAILGDFSPLVEPVSVDEAFVDLTGTASLFGPAPRGRAPRSSAASAPRRDSPRRPVWRPTSSWPRSPPTWRSRTGSWSSRAGREAAFLAPLPIERLWGVGKATAKELEALGIATIGQLQRLPRVTLVSHLGGHGADLLDLAFGRDDRSVEPLTAPKSMGAETTFERDTSDRARLEATLRGQAERVARELRAEHLAAAASPSSFASPTSGRSRAATPATPPRTAWSCIAGSRPCSRARRWLSPCG